MDLSLARTPWDATTMLLRAWEESSAPYPPDADREAFYLWQDLSEHFERELRSVPAGRLLTRKARSILTSADDNGPIGLFSAAWALDQVLHSTFTPAWLGGGTIQPSTGDLVPVPEWTPLLDSPQNLLSLSWRTDPTPGILAHVRRWPELPFEVVFDGTHRHQVDRLASISCVTTLAVNESMDEFDFNGGFPIVAKDLDMQRSRILEAFALAARESAKLVVYPELSVPQEVIGELSAAVADDGSRFVVAGSSHDVVDGVARNVARLILPTGEVIETFKRVRFNTKRFREEIEPDTGPVRVLVGSEVRFAVGVCKDLLDTRVLGTIEAANVNLAAVPSLSRSTALHEIRSQQLAATARTTTVVANGPLNHNRMAPPTMVLTIPVEDPRRVRVGRHGSVPEALTWDLEPHQ